MGISQADSRVWLHLGQIIDASAYMMPYFGEKEFV